MVVFGRYSMVSYCMFTFSEEGEFLEDLCEDPLIPGKICEGSAIVERGRVYVAGQRKLNSKWSWRASGFDGKRWTLL